MIAHTKANIIQKETIYIYKFGSCKSILAHSSPTSKLHWLVELGKAISMHACMHRGLRLLHLLVNFRLPRSPRQPAQQLLRD